MPKASKASAAPQTSGWTALMHAANAGHVDVVRLLADRGAEINVRDPQGWTPLALAALEGHADVVQFLCDRGADVDARTQDGFTSVILAASSGHVPILRFLVDRHAVKAGRKGAAKLVLETMRTRTGESALSRAMHNKHEQAVEYLRSLTAEDEDADDPASSSSYWNRLVDAAKLVQYQVIAGVGNPSSLDESNKSASPLVVAKPQQLQFVQDISKQARLLTEKDVEDFLSKRVGIRKDIVKLYSKTFLFVVFPAFKNIALLDREKMKRACISKSAHVDMVLGLAADLKADRITEASLNVAYPRPVRRVALRKVRIYLSHDADSQFAACTIRDYLESRGVRTTLDVGAVPSAQRRWWADVKAQEGVQGVTVCVLTSKFEANKQCVKEVVFAADEGMKIFALQTQHKFIPQDKTLVRIFQQHMKAPILDVVTSQAVYFESMRFLVDQYLLS